MKINVHAGHTRQNGNAPGASGIVHESIEDRRIKEEVIRLLRERGHTVYDCTSEGDSARNNLYRIVEKCNAHTVDLDVSIHLNCYDGHYYKDKWVDGHGHGTETLIYSSGSKAKSTAKRINRNIVKLGYTDRGVKVRSDLYVLHRTNAPALLVETFFCDNKGDCDLYKKVGYKGIAKAIADGITTKSIKQKVVEKVTKKNSEVTYPTENLWRGLTGEQVGKLQKCLNKLIDAGLKVDNSFGPATEKAVKSFQKKYKLEVDGSVGPKTRAKIKELMK